MKRKKKVKMDRSYVVKKLQICPFEKIIYGQDNWFHPLRNEGYDYVLCVCDFANKRVIEIINEHAYKYIELVAGCMIRKERIINQERYAICPIDVCEYDLSNEEIKKINEIQKKLKEEKETNTPKFINGNYILRNEEYKEIINKEKEKSFVKVKRK